MPDLSKGTEEEAPAPAPEAPKPAAAKPPVDYGNRVDDLKLDGHGESEVDGKPTKPNGGDDGQSFV